MWTQHQKVQSVLWLTEFKSVTRVQRRVRTEWNVKIKISKTSNIKIYPPMGKNFKEDGNLGMSDCQVFLSFRDRIHC
ncbi:hypothetical protein TNCV_2775401 [Trichonephila clavipes]|nr:hypothetical protein TNCV_2775401 [Trichonephila clavipes]